MSLNARRNTSACFGPASRLLASGHSNRRGIASADTTRPSRDFGGQDVIFLYPPLAANTSSVASRGLVAKNVTYLRIGRIEKESVLFPESVGPIRPTC